MNGKNLAILAGAGAVLWYLLKGNGGGVSSVNAQKIGSDVTNTDTLGIGLASLSKGLGLGSSLYLDSPSGSVSVNPQVVGYRLEYTGQSPLFVPVESLANPSGTGENNAWIYLRWKIEGGWKPFTVYSDGSSSPIVQP